MPAKSRTGRKIARRACDLCRDRRVQCIFDTNTSSSCRQCLKSQASCTFLTDRKPRGPRRSRLEPSVLSAAVALTNINNNGSGSGQDHDNRGTNAEGQQEQRSFTPNIANSSSTSSGGGDSSLHYLGQQSTTTEAVTTGPAPLPIALPSVEHLVPEAVFRTILDEFTARVYPVIPLVHIPSFTAQLQARDFATDPAFYRLCMGLCAVTVASIPRNGGSYGAPWYPNVGDLIDRAAHLIMLSSMGTSPAWQNDATVDNIIVYVLLAMAFHYSGRVNAGWAYASDAMLSFRAMELYKKSSYESLSTIETEMCKRAFWLLFIIQVHDRMSFIIPHTGLSYDPKMTDWEFLLPLEVWDEALTPPDQVAQLHVRSDMPGAASPGSPPTISGFVALIKVFLCVADLLDVVFPGPPAHFSLSPGSHTLQYLLPPQEDFIPNPFHTVGPQSEISILDSLLQVMTRLNALLNGLPDELRPIRNTDDNRHVLHSNVPSHFEIMRANIHITSIYIQSMIIEMCLSKVQGLPTNNPEAHAAAPAVSGTGGAHSLDALQDLLLSTPSTDHAVSSPPATSSISSRLWQLKESIARELLEAVTSSPTWVLESNGSSMITKIREIAATLLDRAEESVEQPLLSTSDSNSQEYLAQFVKILADLDHLSRNKV
ncbi:hypothetical protein SCUCBS95973_006359 [Sporothrix curviconia]|uniref:Zn(2)-C6 fungal-type domain-containing protein n=1 Tax=Sporothrix curviconia TaxID=1260050 RepID=A0ABP0C4L9_9PEZI